MSIRRLADDMDVERATRCIQASRDRTWWRFGEKGSIVSSVSTAHGLTEQGQRTARALVDMHIRRRREQDLSFTRDPS
jgi:hypothetical protein